MKFIFKSIMYIAMVWAKPDNSLNKILQFLQY